MLLRSWQSIFSRRMNLLFVPRFCLYLEILGKSLELMCRYVTFTG